MIGKVETRYGDMIVGTKAVDLRFGPDKVVFKTSVDAKPFGLTKREAENLVHAINTAIAKLPT